MLLAVALFMLSDATCRNSIWLQRKCATVLEMLINIEEEEVVDDAETRAMTALFIQQSAIQILSSLLKQGGTVAAWYAQAVGPSVLGLLQTAWNCPVSTLQGVAVLKEAMTLVGPVKYRVSFLKLYINFTILNKL